MLRVESKSSKSNFKPLQIGEKYFEICELSLISAGIGIYNKKGLQLKLCTSKYMSLAVKTPYLYRQ